MFGWCQHLTFMLVNGVTVVMPSEPKASRGIAIVPKESWPLYRDDCDSSTSALRASLGMTGVTSG
jgi:hypothetical protein